MQISAREIAALLRTLSRTANKPHFTSAVIAAAGCGSRMGNTDGVTKQQMELLGLPVIVRTLLEFEKSGYVNEIIVVAKAEEIPLYEQYKRQYGTSKVVAVVEGGDSRQASVLRGFEAISDESEFVAIHDGARCLITTELIDKVIAEAYRRGAASAATPVTDTIKRADIHGYITETVERAELWQAQTPQVFKTELYRAAAYIAKEEEFTATDDNSLAERLGFMVKLVDCTAENIKITTKTDLAIAEIILKSREK